MIDLSRAALACLALTAGALLAPGRLQAQTSAAAAAAALQNRTKGSAAAPVTVYEMSDFQCPYCRQFALETFPQLEQEYIATGKVRWVFINFPLTSIHAHAAAAAQVALCAADQRGFWRMHDLLFRNQERWAPQEEPGPFFLSLADSAKLSRPTMLACLKAPETLEAVKADAEGAARSGAGSTPTFYIEGGLLEGALPVKVFRQVLDSVYKVKAGGKR